MNRYAITVRCAGATYKWVALAATQGAAIMAAYDRFADQDVSVGARPC